VRTHSFLVINPRSGDDSPAPSELAAEAERRGIAAHVLEQGEDPAEVARAAGAERIGVAGGDGSLAAVATVAVESDSAFVCVPYGTRNHFARDLGLDRDDPIRALDAFASPVERRIDTGRVNGRLFLNNVSLGVYASLVHRREHHRRRGEVLAGLRALWLGLRRQRGVWAELDGEPVRARIVLVANNAYLLSLFSIGERERLDEGRLYLYAAKGVLPRTWEEKSGERFELDAPGGTVQAAVDGEPVELETPFELAVEPRALRVLLPRRQD
jgi:diacylglycerol kinase family enzyme